MPGTVVVLFLVGCNLALVPALQVCLMNEAGEAQTSAAALDHSAFNLTNALSTTVGRYAIAQGAGWAVTGWVGAILAMPSVALMALTIHRDRSSTGRRGR